MVTILVENPSMFVLLPPTLTPGEMIVAALWDSQGFYDLDLNMLGPGNATEYPGQFGVLNWEWQEKSAQSPYGVWFSTDLSATQLTVEFITINQLDVTQIYDFVLFDWSRVGGNDPTSSFRGVGATIFLIGGTTTQLGSWAWVANPKNVPASQSAIWWSPFRLLPGNGKLSVTVVPTANAYDPLASNTAIDSGAEFSFPCSYSYCPFPAAL